MPIWLIERPRFQKVRCSTRTVQYKMSSAPTTNPNEPGYIGDFNGEPIVIPQISEILKTRLHYMGNNTVMALN